MRSERESESVFVFRIEIDGCETLRNCIVLKAIVSKRLSVKFESDVRRLSKPLNQQQ
jgi:hypothetical protein